MITHQKIYKAPLISNYKMGNICKVYKGTIELKDKDKSDLLGVLKQGIECNYIDAYNAIVTEAFFQGDGLEKIMRKLGIRSALVQRHMITVQNALKEIYKIAKNGEYKDITEIFERGYPVRHSK